VLVRGSNYQFDKEQRTRANVDGKLTNSSLRNV
jgi:hypothetical protein